VVRLDVFLEERPVRRVPVDVAFFDGLVLLLQKTSGVAARGSGRFPVEDRLGHGPFYPTDFRLKPEDRAGTMNDSDRC
jgi:hypothetical protein